MKCFVHSTIDSIGSCKHCYKGLCLECCVDTGEGLACTGKCTERVKVTHNFLEKTIYKHSIKLSTPNLLFGLISIIFGCYLIYSLGFDKDNIYFGLFFIGMGVIFLLSFWLQLFLSKNKNS
jgi:hypothetical protein